MDNHIKEIIKDAAAEIALGVILRYGKVNYLTEDQIKQLDEASSDIAVVVMSDAFEPLFKDKYE